MEGKRCRLEEIRKGPWKAEEDEVLINHVKRYGPKDWSSIRSRGLLQRTGKSCRLRWVNKLRPNLKNGCKFTAEEERVVIELQAEFGNKWARIATYLPGRTDNDVKNFWSSRQKRLARILHSSTATTSSSSPPISSSSSNAKSPRSGTSEGQVAPAFLQLPTPEAPLFSPSMEEESSFKRQHCSSFFVETPEPIRMEPPPPLPNIVKIELPTCDDTPLQYESQSLVPFPQIPEPHPELTFSPNSHELLTRLGDPYLDIMFGPIAPELEDASQLALPAPLLDPPTTNCMNVSSDVRSSATPDSFFDDFPEDMFDPIEPLPSPSEW